MNLSSLSSETMDLEANNSCSHRSDHRRPHSLRPRFTTLPKDTLARPTPFSSPIPGQFLQSAHNSVRSAAAPDQQADHPVLGKESIILLALVQETKAAAWASPPSSLNYCHYMPPMTAGHPSTVRSRVVSDSRATGSCPLDKRRTINRRLFVCGESGDDRRHSDGRKIAFSPNRGADHTHQTWRACVYGIHVPFSCIWLQNRLSLVVKVRNREEV